MPTETQKYVYVDYVHDKTNEFNELYYTFQFGGKWNWLTVGVGQFPIYNFDGTDYDANQQVNFLNEALAKKIHQLCW